jgi:uncharacterized protein
MKRYENGFVGSRVLKLNVGFLLAGGAGHSHMTEFDVPPVRVADDVDLAYLRGGLRLSRTKEGILVQGVLHLGLDSECYRCLTPLQRDLKLEIEELFASETSAVPMAEFSVGEDGILDLARAEAIIADERGALCRPDCMGLCPDCGANLNNGACNCRQDEIDPRMAKLKQLLDASR